MRGKTKLHTIKATEICDAIAHTDGAVGALVVVQRADGAFDIGIAGPTPAVTPLMKMLKTVEDALPGILGPNFQKKNFMTLDGVPIQTTKQGEEN